MIFGRRILSGKSLGGVIVFTLIELATWDILIGFVLELFHINYYASAIFWKSQVFGFIGFGIEHYIATQVGQQDK